jgi:hypothetical protein
MAPRPYAPLVRIFQDLVGPIFILAVYLDDPDAFFNRDFFYRTPNCLMNSTQI